LLSNYVIKNSLGIVLSEKILITLTRNDYEPDICFFKKEKSDKFLPEQMQFPAPDLIIEVISPSSKEIDRGIKFNDYAFHGIEEYWIIEPNNKIIEQYISNGSEYELYIKSSSGLIKSKVITGFEIPVKAANDDIIYYDTLKKII
jgi:Uma2 family endonuclease